MSIDDFEKLDKVLTFPSVVHRTKMVDLVFKTFSLSWYLYCFE